MISARPNDTLTFSETRSSKFVSKNNKLFYCSYVWEIIYLSFFYVFCLLQIFQALEHPLEVETMREVQTLVILQRQNFIHFIFNGSLNSVIHRERINQVKYNFLYKSIFSTFYFGISSQSLLEYETTVGRAATTGIDITNKEPVYKWSYIQVSSQISFKFLRVWFFSFLRPCSSHRPFSQL